MRAHRRFRLRMPHDLSSKVYLAAHSRYENPDVGWRGAEP